MEVITLTELTFQSVTQHLIFSILCWQNTPCSLALHLSLFVTETCSDNISSALKRNLYRHFNSSKYKEIYSNGNIKIRGKDFCRVNCLGVKCPTTVKTVCDCLESMFLTKNWYFMHPLIVVHNSKKNVTSCVYNEKI